MIKNKEGWLFCGDLKKFSGLKSKRARTIVLLNVLCIFDIMEKISFFVVSLIVNYFVIAFEGNKILENETWCSLGELMKSIVL